MKVESGERSIYVPQTDVHRAGRSVIADKMADSGVPPSSFPPLPLQPQMVTGGVYKVLHKKGTFVSRLRLTASIDCGIILGEVHPRLSIAAGQGNTADWG